MLKQRERARKNEEKRFKTKEILELLNDLLPKGEENLLNYRPSGNDGVEGVET